MDDPIALILADMASKLEELSNLELAFAYVDYLELDSDSYFIQEMQRRGLSFEDLEQELINYYDTED